MEIEDASPGPTFMGFVIPEVPSPRAKMRPEDKGDTNLGTSSS